MEPGAHHSRNPSLVVRLVRGAALWAVPVLVLTAFALTWFYRASTYRLFDEVLDNTIISLIASAETGQPGQSPGEVSFSREPIDPRFQQSLSGRYWLVGRLDESGKIEVINASRSMAGETLTLPVDEAELLLTTPGTELRARVAGPDEDETLRVVARSVILPNMNGEPIIMLAGADGRQATLDIQKFAALAVGLMIFLSGGLIIAVFMQVRLGLKPIFNLRDTVADVREGRATRVDGDYPPEIQPLATELNSLIDHNRDVVEQAQTHVGNLAHALKTPLAVLLNEAGGAKTQFSDLVLRQTGAMQKQVEHHLHRARAAARGQTIGVSASVSETLEPFARTLARIYRDKDIDFAVDVPEELFFRGEKRDLEEMAGNLMDNACKWTRSEVIVRAQTDPENETMMTIMVMDNGPGLPEDAFAEALKRGARLDETTPGTGFGLAIVDDLARAYKGSVKLGRADIGGLSVTLNLPRRVD